MKRKKKFLKNLWLIPFYTFVLGIGFYLLGLFSPKIFHVYGEIGGSLVILFADLIIALIYTYSIFKTLR